MHIFFDIDDTLLASAAAEHQAALELAGLYPAVLGADPAAFAEDWHRVSADFYARWTCGELTFREQRRGRIRHYWGQAFTDDQAEGIFAEYLALYERHWTIFEDVLPCLAALSAYPLAVITNGEPQQQRAKLKALGVACYFSLVVTPEEAGECKPQAAIFAYAAALVGVQPKECVYIGDLLEGDARAAAKAGWRGVWLDRAGSASVEDVPVIHTLMELPAALTRIM
ncbi:MAG: HAD family hydrolase [Chloroflexi bacterium]|nr:HAD family hydrolase [Chloroflexota bacterium]